METGADDACQRAWKLMGEKGLCLASRHQIKSAFANWGREHDPDIEYDRKFETYSNKKFPGYAFRTEQEAKFAGAMADLMPDVASDKICTIMSIIFKLGDVKSEWAFSPMSLNPTKS